MKQVLNSELIDGLSTHFPRSNAAATAWGNLVSNFLLLRRLRGYWSFTSVDENGDVYDFSGQGRVLSFVPGLGAQIFSSTSLLTYAAPIFASGQYYQRLDEVGLSITGKLTWGGWFWFNTLASGADQGLMSKSTGAGNQRGYNLWLDDATNFINMNISSAGTLASTVFLASTKLLAINNWYFVVARYNPSTLMSIYINGTMDTLAAGVPASIFDNNASLCFGSYNAGAMLLDGRVAHCFICADYLEDYFIQALYWHSCPLLGVKP